MKVEEAFLPVAAPASVIPDRKNEYYKSDEELQTAIAEAMRTEYKMIVDAGFLLQLDDARAAVTYDRMVPPGTLRRLPPLAREAGRIAQPRLEGLPADRIRYHVCWGSWPGPHTSDVPLKDIVDLILKVKRRRLCRSRAPIRATSTNGRSGRTRSCRGPGADSRRHQPRHQCRRASRAGRRAHRALRQLVGRENVIAGTDCGFAQGPFYRRVHPSIMWAKLEALSEGARLASKELWN